MTAPAGRVHSWETGSGDERTGSGTDLEAISRVSGTDSELDSDGSSWTARTGTGLDWGAATGGRSGGAGTGAGSDTGGFWTGSVTENWLLTIGLCGDNSGLLRIHTNIHKACKNGRCTDKTCYLSDCATNNICVLF